MSHVGPPGGWPLPQTARTSVNVYALPGRRLRPIGALAQVALFATVVMALALAGSIMHRLDVFNSAIARPTTASAAAVGGADHTVHDWGVAYFVAYVVTTVVFISWFFVARLSAEKHNPDLMRFGRGWAIGAWITPVLGLWRPLQMTTDVLRASDLPAGARTGERRPYPLLAVWWGFFIAFCISTRFYTDEMNTVAAVRRDSWLEIVSCGLSVVAAVLAVVVVGRITGANDRRRAELLRTPPA